MPESPSGALHPQPPKPSQTVKRQHPAMLMTREHLRAIFAAQEAAAKNNTPFGIGISYRNPVGQRDIESANELLNLSNVERVSSVQAITMHEDSSFLLTFVSKDGLSVRIDQKAENSGAFLAYQDVKYALDSANPPPKHSRARILHAVIPGFLALSLYLCVSYLIRQAFPDPFSWLFGSLLALIAIMFLQSKAAKALREMPRRWLFYSLDDGRSITRDQGIQIAMVIATIATPVVITLL
ncbi:hypothetical protein [Brachybacterium conglomeratum]|uniref:hypothetical protein n=1 Tax=Brachybacterium conglomeratum TaxID=47846 RepID=UPI003DA0F5CB